MAEIELRKAVLADISAMAGLINEYAGRGIMLPRTAFELAESVRDFVVAYDGSTLVGCGALHIYTPDSAEIRSLAVDSGAQKSGIGRRIVEALEQEASEFGLAKLFAFTYVPEFFSKLGFDQVDRSELPLKAWKDCLKCPKFKACDENAVLKKINAAPFPVTFAPIRGEGIRPILTRTEVLESRPKVPALWNISLNNR
jgi:amino-acid N-acetyltransferase